jgi:hypothetical protein
VLNHPWALGVDSADVLIAVRLPNVSLSLDGQVLLSIEDQRKTAIVHRPATSGASRLQALLIFDDTLIRRDQLEDQLLVGGTPGLWMLESIDPAVMFKASAVIATEGQLVPLKRSNESSGKAPR